LPIDRRLGEKSFFKKKPKKTKKKSDAEAPLFKEI